MRFPWTIAFAALVLAGPAQADITARYRQSTGEPDMIVQVNDLGESRMNVTEAAYVTTGGVAYVLVTDDRGGYVVRHADFMSLLDELVRATSPAGPPTGTGPVRIEEGGTETVGGVSGRVFRLSDPRNPSDAFELVIATDPALAPLGRAMAAPLVPVFATMQGGAPGIAEAMTQVLGRGALLRFGHVFRLASIESGPIPASAFVLPSTPISREALAERLGVAGSR
jgi:hypothetical protein